MSLIVGIYYVCERLQMLHPILFLHKNIILKVHIWLYVNSKRDDGVVYYDRDVSNCFQQMVSYLEEVPAHTRLIC